MKTFLIILLLICNLNSKILIDSSNRYDKLIKSIEMTYKILPILDYSPLTDIRCGAVPDVFGGKIYSIPNRGGIVWKDSNYLVFFVEDKHNISFRKFIWKKIK